MVVKGSQEGKVRETYAPVVDFTSVRLALACLPRNAIVQHLDIKSAFLNGLLDKGEEIYVNPPAGLDLVLKPGKGLRLRKALYGLKKAMRIWERTFRKTMQQIGFKQLRCDKCFYVSIKSSTVLWVLVYVDDILIMSESKIEVQGVIAELRPRFELTDNGRVRSFMGVEFLWSPRGVILRQKGFIQSIVDRFGLPSNHTAKTPVLPYTEMPEDSYQVSDAEKRKFQSIIGALLFLSTRTRPDIAAAVDLMGRRSNNPSMEDLNRLQRIIRYSRATMNFGLHFSFHERLERNQC